MKRFLSSALLLIMSSSVAINYTGPSFATSSDVFIEVKVANYSACALTPDGSVHCWGRLIDTQMPEQYKPAKNLALVDDNYACVISAQDDLKCWWKKEKYYWNGKSQTTPELIGLIPKNLGSITQVSSTSYSACAITLENSVRCWGDPLDVTELRVPANLGQAVKINRAYSGYCVLTSESQLKCWGRTVLDHSSARCNVSSEGALRCWNTDGQTIFNSRNDLVEDFYSGQRNVCVKRKTPSALNHNFCLGSSSNSISNIPNELASMPNLKSIEVGLHIACSVSGTGAVDCWGEDYSGGAKVPLSREPYQSLSIGYWVTCALSSEGTLLCWGDDEGKADKLRFGPPKVNSAPTLFLGGESGSTGIAITWKNNVSNLQIDSYHLEIRAVRERWRPAKISGRAGSIQKLVNLKPATLYELRMRSKNKAGYSAFSKIYSVKTFSKCPQSIINKRIEIEKKIKNVRNALQMSRSVVLAAREDRVRVEKSLRNFKDYSKIPAMKALIYLRDQYERQMVIALNSGNIALAARRAGETRDLEITISKLLGPYPAIKAQIESAYEYETEASRRMQVVEDKLGIAIGELDSSKSMCAVRN